MNDEAKCCALPGCDVAIVDVPGRPARRYCSAAHRHAARAARRAAMRPEVQARLSETLPWLQEPVPPRPAPAAAPAAAIWTPPRPAATRSPRPGRASTRPRTRKSESVGSRRRAAAVLGAVGILAGGYAVSAAVPLVSPVQPALAGRAPTGAEWAAKAEITLASVTKQLDTIARTEAAYSRLPAADRTSIAALPYAALQQRKSLLERRKAALLSQLDSYRGLTKAKADLAASQSRLDAVEEAIAQSPSRVPGSTEEATAVAVLDEQRSLRTRQRDARKAELTSLEDSVAAAVQAPLPADDEETDAVSTEVLQAMERRDTGRGPGRPSNVPAKPQIVSGRGEEPKERDETATSGPPDPRGPADDTPRSRSAGPRGDRNPIGQALGTVLGSAGDGLDAATRAAQPPAQRSAPGQGEPQRPKAKGAQRPAQKASQDEPGQEPKSGVGKVLDGAEETLLGKRDPAPEKGTPKDGDPGAQGDAAEPAPKQARAQDSDRSGTPARGKGVLSPLLGGARSDSPASGNGSGPGGTGARGGAPGGLTYWGGGQGDSDQADSGKAQPSRTGAGATTTDRGSSSSASSDAAQRPSSQGNRQGGSTAVPQQRSGSSSGQSQSSRGPSTLSRSDESGTSTLSRDDDGFTATRTTPDGRSQSVRIGNDGSMSVRESGGGDESSASRPSTKSQRQSRSAGSSDSSSGARSSGSQDSGSRSAERSTRSSSDDGDSGARASGSPDSGSRSSGSERSSAQRSTSSSRSSSDDDDGGSRASGSQDPERSSTQRSTSTTTRSTSDESDDD